MIVEHWPFTNFHDLNLDWILRKIKEQDQKLADFELYFPHVSTHNDGVWDSTYNYKPNEIVSWSNGVYIAKKDVPTGTSISNEEYWLKLADIDVDVEEIEERFDELEQELRQDVADLEQQLTDDVSALNDRVDELEEDITNSLDRRIIMIFDSYGLDRNGRLNPTLPEAIKASLGWDNTHFYYSALGGAGFCRGNYLTQLQGLDQTVTNKNSITDIYVVGGYNDITTNTGVSEAQFISSTNAFKAYANEHYPHAALHVAFCAWRNDEYPTALDTARIWYMRMNQRGWDVLYNMQWYMHNPFYYESGDTVHPNQYGVTAMMQGLVNCILSGSCDCEMTITWTEEYFNAPFTDSWAAALNANNDVRLIARIYNDQCRLFISGRYGAIPVMAVNPENGAYTNRTVVLGGPYLPMFKMSSYIIKSTYENISMPATAIFITNSNTSRIVPGYVRILDGAVTFRTEYSAIPITASYNADNRQTVAAVTGFYLQITQTTIPTLFI